MKTAHWPMRSMIPNTVIFMRLRWSAAVSSKLQFPQTGIVRRLASMCVKSLKMNWSGV